MSAINLSLVEKKLGIEFKDKDLLSKSLTHSSYANENNLAEYNERLEFLGDSVLGLVITEYIYLQYPQLREGDLAKLRANLVNADLLAKLAAELGLGDFVLMSRGTELAGGRENKSILADGLEALIGAIYLDRGYQTARKFILGRSIDKIKKQAGKKVFSDPKSTLQELTMEKWSLLPDYKVVRSGGPPHKPIFSAEVYINGRKMGAGEGRNKKVAEQAAAAAALDALTAET